MTISNATLEDEAYTSSVKLQRHSLESANAHERAAYLERENSVIRTELAVLRAHPHPDGAPQAHPAVAQAQQLTLSLRRLSDKLSLTETALSECTTQLSHATAEAGKAKLTAEAAYELAARTRGREEAGKLRELELEWKVKAAEESAKMSDLVVNEYADLVRSLDAKQPHEQLADVLAEGKLGLQRLLYESAAESARFQKELLEAQAAQTAAEAQRASEKMYTEQCRIELAQVQFELQQLKIDDMAAAKMVSRYMKFSQKSTDTLSDALTSLKARHAATTATLSFQILSLDSQLQASETQAETLRRALDELGGELAKEAFGRRREVALRIRMVNREEKLRSELERWLLRAEEAREDVDVEKMVNGARALLDGLLGGSEGSVGSLVVAEAAVQELTMELEVEMARRLELERLIVLEMTKEAPLANGHADDHGHGLEHVEKPVQIGADDPLLGVTKVDLTIEPQLLTLARPTIVLTPSSPVADEDSKPLPHLPPTPPLSLGDTILDEAKIVIPASVTHSLPLSITDETTADTALLSAVSSPQDIINLEFSASSPVEDIIGESSTNGSAHQDSTSDALDASKSKHIEIPEQDGSHLDSQLDDVDTPKLSDAAGDVQHEVDMPPSAGSTNTLLEERPDALLNQRFFSNGVGLDSSTGPDRESHSPPTPSSVAVITEHESTSEPSTGSASIPISSPIPTISVTQESEHISSPIPATQLSITAPSPIVIVPDISKPAPHPLLAELAKTEHRYDTLQRSLRDCHLALEALTVSLAPQSTMTGRVLTEALRTAVQRLNDYTEDARVELEIRLADEALAARGFETLLSVPGAIAETPIPHLYQEDADHNHDAMTHSDVMEQVRAFVDSTDTSVSRAMHSLSRKLEDIEHDITALKRAAYDDNDETLVPPAPNDASAGGWTSWIRSSPASPASPPASAPGPTPTFGSVMTSPHLRHSPSLNFPKKRTTDPLANLGLKVPMPSYIHHQAGPAAVQPRSRTLSTMYMMGLGARRVSAPGPLSQSITLKSSPALSNGGESESDSEDNDVE
ncbi:hypothetical protein DXG01_016498 [Tephrocybe rancida]|nr:hypothetical protein DXG01_016498 [Tephrocybe rancida]